MVTDNFCRSRLDQMIDLRHPLAVLAHAQLMPWSQIEAALAPALAWSQIEAALAPALAHKHRRHACR